jgi:arsenical resistance protein ArsH
MFRSSVASIPPSKFKEVFVCRRLPAVLWTGFTAIRSISLAAASNPAASSNLFPNGKYTHPSSLLQKGHSMTQSSDTDALWNGQDKERFNALDHPGYAVASDPETHLGGWLAHRAAIMDASEKDWIQTEVVPYISQFDYVSLPIGRAPRILVLYGSLREASFSRRLAYEFARLLEVLGCDVRVYNPLGLPVRNPDDNGDQHVKVQEIRALTHWSDGHVWVSPEMHGATTGVFKNQIDWIPLNTGSVRPTQGKTCCIAQVNGGSQSFNAVNSLRILARWMRMPCCTNQSSVPKAWQEFDETTGRMKPSDYRNRVVDVAEEFAKFTAVLAPVSEQLTDRYSERREVMEQGRLLTQAEKEKQATIDAARKA